MANIVMLNKSLIIWQQQKLILCRHSAINDASVLLLRCAATKRRRISLISLSSLHFPNSNLYYNSIPIRYSSFVPLSQSRFSSMSASNSTSDYKTVRVEIKGRVQGVFYRDWTVGNAKELGLKGWVRNRRDGSVEALFSGSSEKVEEMEQRCRRGPPQAMVTGLQVFPCSDDPGNSFERKPTA